ncbi:MAG TPA: DUF1801 domain-containing protein [Candidatus Limnocylindrales bacterium]|nr:DUF1801 domain-containing protein [Candidatus Limnocylindrales bacterium]
MTVAGAAAFEAYVAAQPLEHAQLLRDLRSRVLALVPRATDAISYGMPALKLDGAGLVWFASWKRHCSVYPVGPAFLASHPELAGYGHTEKGALHFTRRQPLSEAVLADLVAERLAALAADGGR